MIKVNVQMKNGNSYGWHFDEDDIVGPVLCGMKDNKWVLIGNPSKRAVYVCMESIDSLEVEFCQEPSPIPWVNV